MKGHVRKFHLIAPIYQSFFKFQVLYYSKIIKKHLPQLTSEREGCLLDLGCGTGAFAFSWQKAGFKVLAADAAPGMIRQCLQNGLDCIELDILEKLPFADNSFKIITAAYLAHGLTKEERIILYRESSRVAEKLVVFHDFSTRFNLIISFIEALEGSHYNEFINAVPDEMGICFRNVRVIPVNPWHNWYVCEP